MDKSISDKLKAMGMQKGVAKLTPKPVKSDEFSIEKVLDGEEDTNQFGSTFYVKTRFPKSYRHGALNLAYDTNLEAIASWARLKDASYPDAQRIVFLDTETSGLAGGTGTYVFLVGFGYFTEDGFEVNQIFMRGLEQELPFLASFNHFLSPFDVMVTYNGKTFDIPLLINRHILNGFTPHFDELGHIDFLHLARKIWKNRFESRRLADLEMALLGMARNQNEVPGWAIPDIYFEYLETGDARPLAGVFYHNQMDIVSLAALFNLGATLIEGNPETQGINSLDAIGIGRFYEDIHSFDKSENFYEHSLSQGVPEEFQVKILMRRAHLFRKQGEWNRAVELWEEAAAHSLVSPCIELAKYFEHQAKDLSQAINWTKLALQYLREMHDQHYSYETDLINLQKRLDRLVKLSENEKRKKI